MRASARGHEAQRLGVEDGDDGDRDQVVDNREDEQESA
jgi:hypothetical protein